MHFHPSSDPAEGHTAKAFDAALAELRLHIVAMGGLVIDQVATAVRALLDGDASWRSVVLSREVAASTISNARSIARPSA